MRRGRINGNGSASCSKYFELKSFDIVAINRFASNEIQRLQSSLEALYLDWLERKTRLTWFNGCAGVFDRHGMAAQVAPRNGRFGVGFGFESESHDVLRDMIRQAFDGQITTAVANRKIPRLQTAGVQRCGEAQRNDVAAHQCHGCRKRAVGNRGRDKWRQCEISLRQTVRVSDSEARYGA